MFRYEICSGSLISGDLLIPVGGWRFHPTGVSARARFVCGDRRGTPHSSICIQACQLTAASCAATGTEREFFIDNLLVRIHFIIVMICWIGLAPWEFEFFFPGSLTSTFLVQARKPGDAAQLGGSLSRDLSGRTQADLTHVHMHIKLKLSSTNPWYI